MSEGMTPVLEGRNLTKRYGHVTALDNSAFDLGQTLSWGRFMSPLDSLTVTSNGYVVGVNRVTHKMEVLLLPSQAVDAASTPTIATG